MSEKDLVNVLVEKLKKRDVHFDKEVYVKSYIADLVINNKVAIEAKLSDINKAMYQCTAYTTKYDHVYLYMPDKKKKLVKKHEATLRKLGIRWFFLSADNNLIFGDKRWEKTLFQ